MSTNESALRFWTVQDADPRVLDVLDGQRVAVLGYGNLGHALAANLRDSAAQSGLQGGSFHLIVGNIDDDYARRARLDGFTVLPIGEAVAAADLILVLLPDEVIPEVFVASVQPNLSPGAAVFLASGYTLAYGLIHPPQAVDVLLLAPRMGGEQIRERFVDRQGFFAYAAVEQDASGQALRRLLAIAHAAGVLEAGALELDARREAGLDLFVEQTLGAIIGVAVMSAFTLGVEAGFPPEAMVMEMYMSGEMESVFRAFREMGFFRTSEVHGPTAMYGGYLRTMELMFSDIPSRFRETLAHIQSGEFAHQFQAEHDSGYPALTQAQSMAAEQGPIAQPIAEAEKRLRALLGGRSSGPLDRTIRTEPES